MKYLLSKQLDALGQKTIQKYHQHLAILEIAFIFRDEAPNSSHGELLFGQAISIDSRNWLLHKKDVMVMICQDLFDAAPETYQEMLIDHELCHIGIEKDDQGVVVCDEESGRPKVFTIRHDIEEFDSIIKRYGDTWHKWREWRKQEVERRMKAKEKKSKKEQAVAAKA